VVDRIDAVTADDIQALAVDLFKDHKLALTILGPVANTDIYEAMLTRN
jgi:predicted Zn-dependent peptidase